MSSTKWKFLAALAAVLLLGIAILSATAEVDDQLMAKGRVFASVGPGLRALRHGADGKYYLLASPNVGIAVFDSFGKQLKVIAAAPSGETAGKPGASPISFGEDLDIDSSGILYVADHGSNSIRVLSPDGSLLRSISFNSPTSLAVLPEGEVAVSAPRSYHLVTVFDSKGRLVREFGDPEQTSQRDDLNRYLSIGGLASDPQGHLYYGYTFMPEPLVRMYDRFGFAKLDFQFTNIDAFSEARAMRREIERQEKRSEPPSLHPLLTAFGVDPVNGDLWMALHNTLLHFDKDGNRRSEYQIYTKDGARLEANVILVEENRLLIGSDPLGVYEFARPDRHP
jgi:DNA-binding beta-propeller fold protein YncE